LQCLAPVLNKLFKVSVLYHTLYAYADKSLHFKYFVLKMVPEAL